MIISPKISRCSKVVNCVDLRPLYYMRTCWVEQVREMKDLIIVCCVVLLLLLSVLNLSISHLKCSYTFRLQDFFYVSPMKAFSVLWICFVTSWQWSYFTFCSKCLCLRVLFKIIFILFFPTRHVRICYNTTVSQSNHNMFELVYICKAYG